jgi:hypothetical protein
MATKANVMIATIAPKSAFFDLRIKVLRNSIRFNLPNSTLCPKTLRHLIAPKLLTFSKIAFFLTVFDLFGIIETKNLIAMKVSSRSWLFPILEFLQNSVTHAKGAHHARKL